MLLLGVLIGLCVLLASHSYLLPIVYSCITWNYSLLAACTILLYTNLIAYVLCTIVYFCLPTSLKDTILQEGIRIYRTLFPESVRQTETHIRDTFQIHIGHPIPKRAIHIWHPHGVSAITPVIHNGYRLTSPDYMPTKGVVHYAYFWIPLVKDIIRNLHAISSEYTSIRETVEKESISIALGGLDEMGQVNDKQMELSIRNRKGIFKIALETGTPIVPIITYGENELFPQSANPLLTGMNDVLYSVFRFRLPIPTFGSVLNWVRIQSAPLPPIHTYTGKPILVKKIVNPTAAHIAKLRDIYIQRIETLFTNTSPPGYRLTIR